MAFSLLLAMPKDGSSRTADATFACIPKLFQNKKSDDRTDQTDPIAFCEREMGWARIIFGFRFFLLCRPGTNITSVVQGILLSSKQCRIGVILFT
jgi:hypothetical protein